MDLDDYVYTAILMSGHKWFHYSQLHYNS